MTTLRAYATVTGTAARFVAPGGHVESLTASAGEDIRAAVLRRAADEARRAAMPIELITSGDRGDHQLLVDADGTLHPMVTPVAAAPIGEPDEDPDASSRRRHVEQE